MAGRLSGSPTCLPPGIIAVKTRTSPSVCDKDTMNLPDLFQESVKKMCGLEMIDRCVEMLNFADYGDEHDRESDI